MTSVIESRGLINKLLTAVWDLSIIVLGMNRQIDRQTALFIYRMIMNAYELRGNTQQQ